jgi:hypothetical protein
MTEKQRGVNNMEKVMIVFCVLGAIGGVLNKSIPETLWPISCLIWVIIAMGK